MADRTKPPTLKQFARIAKDAANGWFGGDIASVYGVLGLKSPVAPERVALMPAGPRTLSAAVWAALDGNDVPISFAPRDKEGIELLHVLQKRSGGCYRLARGSVQYVQLQEALGRSPTIKEYGQRNFEVDALLLADEVDAAWSLYEQAIEVARRHLTDGAPMTPVVKAPGVSRRGRPAAVAELSPQRPADGGQHVKPKDMKGTHSDQVTDSPQPPPARPRPKGKSWQFWR